MSPCLSDRANRSLAAQDVPEYLVEHVARRTSPDPAVRDGYICLAVAENKLMWDFLDRKANAVRGVEAAAFGYAEHWGASPFRERISRFGSEALWHEPIDPETIVTMAGAGATLEATFASLCNPGEGVLIPTPSYAAYWLDIETRIGLHGIPVPASADDAFRLHVSDLEAAFRSSPVPISALLLTNPTNPTGQVVSDQELTNAVAWARDRNIHIVVNELYALSTYGTKPFTSITRLVDRRDDIHLIWGFSKDFAASGLRCGVLISNNVDLIAAVHTHAMFSVVSGDTQHLFSTMLADPDWLADYIAEMRTRLATSSRAVTEVLTSKGVGHLEADAGLFLLADMRAALDIDTWEAEATAWRTMLEHTGVNLTPGASCRAPEPGFMRICFATEQPDVVVDALDRALTSVL